MHITISIELSKAFIRLILKIFQYKSKTQKNTRYKERNSLLNEQLTFVINNYLRNFFLL